MRITILFILMLSTLSISAQSINCNTFKWEGDSCKYEACIFVENSKGWFQLTKEFHLIFDEALEICPDYYPAFRAKSVSYLKTGDFINWKKYIDKAVAAKPELYLGYRGWCRFQFFRDYEGCIKDLERLETLLTHDIGFCQNGFYHLNIAKGMCYKMIGQKEKALQIMLDQVNKDASSIGLFDYLHIGVLHLELGQLEEAELIFKKQIKENDIAENAYYMGLLEFEKNNKEEAIKYLEKALRLYQEDTTLFDPYGHQVDKIYEIEIIEKIAEIKAAG